MQEIEFEDVRVGDTVKVTYDNGDTLTAKVKATGELFIVSEYLDVWRVRLNKVELIERPVKVPTGDYAILRERHSRRPEDTYVRHIDGKWRSLDGYTLSDPLVEGSLKRGQLEVISEGIPSKA